MIVVVNDELIGLYEPSYTIRVTYVHGGVTQLDYLWLETEVPAENSSWGFIKTLYRE